MSFVLEKKRLNDYKKIIKNSGYDLRLRQDLVAAHDYDANGFKYWAVDCDRDYYMFSIPSMVNDGSMGTEFYIFYRKKFYKIHTLSSFCNRVVVDDKLMLPASMENDFKQVLDEAFAVCGRFGTGIFNEIGDPEFFIKPEIVDEEA